MRSRKSGAFYTDNAESLPLNRLNTRKVYKKPFVFSSALYSVWSVCSVVIRNKNVCALVSESGEVVAKYDYTPFGKLINTFNNPNSAFHNPYLFSSEYFDEETGLVYYNYRYYNPELGRWMSQDPIGERGGLNLYTFVRNWAISIIDILGCKELIAEETDVTSNHVNDAFDAKLERNSDCTCILTVSMDLDFFFKGGKYWTNDVKMRFVNDWKRVVKDRWEKKYTIKPLSGSKPACSNVEVVFDFKTSMKNTWTDHWEIYAYDGKFEDHPSWLGYVDPNSGETHLAFGANDNHLMWAWEDAIDKNGNTYVEGSMSYDHWTSAHEFGHMLGLPDEYPGQAPAGSSYTKDFVSIMNYGGHVRERHYKPFVDWINKSLSDDSIYGVE